MYISPSLQSTNGGITEEQVSTLIQEALRPISDNITNIGKSIEDLSSRVTTLENTP